MSTTIILTILIGICIAGGLGITLYQILKDKTVTSDEQTKLRELIISTITELIGLSEVKTDLQLLDYSTTIVMSELTKNNITNISENTVVSAIQLLIKLNTSLNEKLANKII